MAIPLSAYDRKVIDAGYKFIPQTQYLLNPFQIPTIPVTSDSDTEIPLQAPTGIRSLSQGGDGLASLGPQNNAAFLGNYQNIDFDKRYSFNQNQNQNQIDDEIDDEIPGFNFIDAPTSLMSRIQNPQFLDNPRTGFIDNTLMQTGNPRNSIIDKAKSGIMKGLSLGKTAIGGLASLASGIPALGLALGLGKNIGNMFENRPLGAAVIDEFGNTYDEGELNSQNALGGYYTDAARSARRRTARITNMLNRQKLDKKISLKNLVKLQAQEKAQEDAKQAAADRMQAENKASGKTGGYQAGYGGDFMDGPSDTIGGQNLGLGGEQGGKGGTATVGSS